VAEPVGSLSKKECVVPFLKEPTSKLARITVQSITLLSRSLLELNAGVPSACSEMARYCSTTTTKFSIPFPYELPLWHFLGTKKISFSAEAGRFSIAALSDNDVEALKWHIASPRLTNPHSCLITRKCEAA
jgi:hypothetical protein